MVCVSRPRSGNDLSKGNEKTMQSKLVQLLVAVACVVLLGGVVFADNCPTTTLDNYLGAGYSCGIDDKTLNAWLAKRE